MRDGVWRQGEKNNSEISYGSSNVVKWSERVRWDSVGKGFYGAGVASFTIWQGYKILQASQGSPWKGALLISSGIAAKSWAICGVVQGLSGNELPYSSVRAIMTENMHEGWLKDIARGGSNLLDVWMAGDGVPSLLTNIPIIRESYDQVGNSINDNKVVDSEKW